MFVTQDNAQTIAEEIELSKGSSTVYYLSVFSESRFEVGYEIKPRWRGYNPKTGKYDGNWVEPYIELTKFLREGSRLIISKYNKVELNQRINSSILYTSCDITRILNSWLCQDPENQDLKEIWESKGRKMPTVDELEQEVLEIRQKLNLAVNNAKN